MDTSDNDVYSEAFEHFPSARARPAYEHDDSQNESRIRLIEKSKLSERHGLDRRAVKRTSSDKTGVMKERVLTTENVGQNLDNLEDCPTYLDVFSMSQRSSNSQSMLGNGVDHVDRDSGLHTRNSQLTRRSGIRNSLPKKGGGGGGGEHVHDEPEEYSYAYTVHGNCTRESTNENILVRDDYSQPQDSLRSSGISNVPSPPSGDYAEPYHSVKLKSKSVPQALPDPDQDSVYELAKNVDSPSSNLQKSTFEDTEYNTTADVSAQLEQVGLQEYDHISTWCEPKKSQINSKKGAALTASGPRRTSNSSDEVFISNMHHVSAGKGTKVVAGKGAPVSAGKGAQAISNYEDPWDTEEGQKRFSEMLNRAEKRYSVEHRGEAMPKVVKNKTPPPLPIAANYEEPWDTEERQKQFSQILDSAERKSSVPKKSPDRRISPKMSGDAVVNRRSPQRSPKHSPAGNISPVHNQHPPPVPKHSHNFNSHPQPAPSMYEEAWDSRASQRRLEDSIGAAERKRSAQVSPTHVDHSHWPPRVSGSGEDSPTGNGWSRRSPDFGNISPTRRNTKYTETHTPPYSRSDSCKSLSAIAEKIDPTIPLEEQNFYHGTIKRTEAERLLNVFKDGSYLVRRSESNKNDYSLTMRGAGGMPMHIKISSKPDEAFVLGENSPPFKNISEMIHYYTHHELPVKNAGRLCLLYPIPN